MDSIRPKKQKMGKRDANKDNSNSPFKKDLERLAIFRELNLKQEILEIPSMRDTYIQF